MHVNEIIVLKRKKIIFMTVDFMDYIRIIKINFASLEIKSCPLLITLPPEYPQSLLVDDSLRLLVVVMKPMRYEQQNSKNGNKGSLVLRKLNLKAVAKIDIPYDFNKIFLRKKKDIFFDIFCKDEKLRRFKLDKKV